MARTFSAWERTDSLLSVHLDQEEAADPGGSPMGEAFSLHTMDALSMNSMVDGTIFAAMMAETVSAASSTSLNRARIVAFASGMGMSFRMPS